MPTPSELGLPYDDWRSDQWETIERIHRSDKPVVVLSAPTGRGKSGIAVALAHLDSGRSLIVTRTIALQEQYLRDFSLTSMMGRRNYGCIIGYQSAGAAPCASGGPCVYKGRPLCDYYAARIAASLAPTLVTNYDYVASSWDARGGSGHPLHGRDLIVCDEAHLLEEALRQGVEFSPYLLRRAPVSPPTSVDLGEWVTWGKAVIDALSDELEEFREASKSGVIDPANYKRLRPAIELADRAVELLTVHRPAVVIRDTGVRVVPLFANRAFRRLMEARKVVLMSATLPAPDVLAHMLGLSNDEFEVIELGSTFPAAARPFFFHPVVKVKRGMPDADLDELAKWMDHYIEAWGKGIVHTHAYWLSAAMLKRSRYRSRLIDHESGGLGRAVERFRASPDGWLISPVAHSGLDLPYDLVRGQVMLKLPAPDLGDPAVAARRETIPESYELAIAATLVQAYGRAVRAEDDYGRTVILDSNMLWWYRQHQALIPPWVQEAVRR